MISCSKILNASAAYLILFKTFLISFNLVLPKLSPPVIGTAFNLWEWIVLKHLIIARSRSGNDLILFWNSEHLGINVHSSYTHSYLSIINL